MGTRKEIMRERISCDRDFFINDSSELYYLLGFLFGDGWIEFNGTDRWCRVRLSTTDESVCKLFQSWVKTTQKIGRRVPRQGMQVEYRLSIVDRVATEKMLSCGLIERKSINGAIPNISDVYFWPFFVGMIDSDGCISRDARFNSVFIRCYGHSSLICWIKRKLEERGIEFKSAVDKTGLYEVRIAKRDNVLKIWRLVKDYEFRLKRKWNIIDEWVEKNKTKVWACEVK